MKEKFNFEDSEELGNLSLDFPHPAGDDDGLEEVEVIDDITQPPEVRMAEAPVMPPPVVATPARAFDFTDPAAEASRVVNIKVIGVGGAGCNAITSMIDNAMVHCVDFITANTDLQALDRSKAKLKVQIGRDCTRGLGAGARPDMGRQAALEDRDRIREAIQGADMVFVTAGMGGGTGTGAAPVIAQIARECGALTVGVVTRPFPFEGKPRARNAEGGIAELRQSVDALVTIPNSRLLALAGNKMSMKSAFLKADEVLGQAVKGIADIVTESGLVNVDFADVRTIMEGAGLALMGTGMAKGESRAVEAARMAVNSPLLDEVSIHGAMGVLINVTGSSDFTLAELDEATSLIQKAAHEDANIIVGAVIDESMGEYVRVTVVATGFAPAVAAQPQPQPEQRLVAPIPAVNRSGQRVYPSGQPWTGANPSATVMTTPPPPPSIRMTMPNGETTRMTPNPRESAAIFDDTSKDLDSTQTRVASVPPAAQNGSVTGRRRFSNPVDFNSLDVPAFLRRNQPVKD